VGNHNKEFKDYSMGSIKKITINGFKSIKELNDFELKRLNIIVGANGVGKSNLLQVFRMLLAMVNKNFQTFILSNGGADSFPFNGLKETPQIKVNFEFESDGYYAQGNNFYTFELSSKYLPLFILSTHSLLFIYQSTTGPIPSSNITVLSQPNSFLILSVDNIP
jgi:predicted ATP-dependent endonuclease of OLD family